MSDNSKPAHTPGPWRWKLKPYAMDGEGDDAPAEVSIVNSVGVCRAADARPSRGV